MLWTIFIILIILWFLGFITATTFGGTIHVLLVIALIIFIIQMIGGRRTN